MYVYVCMCLYVLMYVCMYVSSLFLEWVDGSVDLIAVGTQECEYSARKGYMTCSADWFATVSNHLGMW